eukprot:4239484-Prorocentrum_lima.AAC.1
MMRMMWLVMLTYLYMDNKEKPKPEVKLTIMFQIIYKETAENLGKSNQVKKETPKYLVPKLKEKLSLIHI